ncbi:Uncharacterised protein g3139 [Pycnogonum litorale]
MPRSVLCKVLQKGTYDFLSSKYSFLLCFVGSILVVVSAFHFGEHLIEWSRLQYSIAFDTFRDNVGGESYQGLLCQYLPIDVVYTWVNGSDPNLVAKLRLEQLRLDAKFNKTRYYDCGSDPNCVQSHLVLVDRLDIGVFDLLPIRNNVLTITPINHPSCNNYTLIKFNSTISAMNAVKYLSNVSDVRGKKLVAQQAAIVQEESKHDIINDEKLYNVPYLLMVTDLPEDIKSSDSAKNHLPDIVSEITKEVFWFPNKNIAVIDVGDAKNAEFIIETYKHLSRRLKTPNFHRVSIVLFSKLPHDDITDSRFSDNEELRYSLRSVEMHAPWIRHVYIVTNGQIPSWLNLDNPKVSIVTHQELFSNKSHLPTFSSPAIETHIHKIPGLSNKFLYLNDDVFFGKQMVPDDFYSKQDGFKVYLTWPVPNCAIACPTSWIKDGYCDKACNVSNCQWDGGDCFGKIDSQINLPSSHILHKEMFCSSSCVNSWIADRYCDQVCNVIECGFDATDCGIKSYKHLYSVNLNCAVDHYTIPKGVSSGYFNLTNFITNGCVNNSSTNSSIRVTSGTHSVSHVIRSITINQVFNALTFVLVRNSKPEVISIRLLCLTRGNHSFNFQFNINVDTTIVNASSTTNADEISVTSPMQNVTSFPVIFDDILTQIRHPQIDKSLNYSLENSSYSFVNISASNLPNHLKHRIMQLANDFSNGELTYKGFKVKKAELFSEYLKKVNRERLKMPKLVFSNYTYLSSLFSSANHSQSNWSTEQINDRPVRESAKEIPANIKFIDNQKDFKVMPLYSISETGNFMNMTKFQSMSTKLLKFDGIFPWEKDEEFKYPENGLPVMNNTSYMSSIQSRKLLDTFADSLLHVNELYNRVYGFQTRRVPGHIAHLIDKNIMYKLQEKFPSEFDKTSSHKIRSKDDMQFSFSYFYFLMSDMRNVSVNEIFDQFDADHSKTLSDRELRVLLTRLHNLPLDYNVIRDLEDIINNCSRSLPSSETGIQNKVGTAFERFHNLNLPVVTDYLITNCPKMSSMLSKKFGNEIRYRYAIMNEDEVTFKMLESNVTNILNQLDSVRKKPTKFICLNDNINHRHKDAKIIKTFIRDFFESMYPTRSRFELPSNYRNQFGHIDELRSFLAYKKTVKIALFVALVLFILIVLLVYSKCLERRCRLLRLRTRRIIPLSTCNV